MLKKTIKGLVGERGHRRVAEGDTKIWKNDVNPALAVTSHRGRKAIPQRCGWQKRLVQ